ncbi:hypothetical protein A1O3_08689 [Capronia epimyces CBS 606.96]|uniref:Phosphatidic acid phosphatase type 2/haloperoxidase domain-containing protein n=1 Tax=Capronia epimyces CBS 606.96 TaxID=1182542 RepID=W9XG22_9EURO|nr:uncharacterized protein A1O3_08689 [Capronia epimyces CBS 606.96]EXJ79188.1 hypothetical protein A1O3_08689 [Capronia epimyces CBS 606.96]
MDRLRRHLQFHLSSPTKPQIPARAIVSYIADYLIIMQVPHTPTSYMGVLAIVYAALDKLVTPFSQHFSLNNIYIQYPYAVHERIPIHIALLISAAFPAVVILIYTLFIDGLFSHHRRTTHARSKYSIAERLWELNCGWLGLLLAQGAAFVITGTLKNLCGRPRPDLIDRCQPRAGSTDGVPYGLVTKAICTQQDESIMQDGFRSFPSGHSSSSFAGLFFLSLYLAAKLHVLDHRGEVWRTLIVLIPTLAASCIAMSRIMDARHHPFDVLFGSALGILCAWGAYRQYFPPVSHVWEKGHAYPIRSWGSPIKRPVPGKVLVDSQTLEVLNDRVAAADDDDDNDNDNVGYETNAIPSRYELASAANRRPTRHRESSLDVDLETGYGGVGSPLQQHQQQQYGSVTVPPTLMPSSTGNVFRNQLEQNRHLRAGNAGPDSLSYSPNPSPSPDRGRGQTRALAQHDDVEDDDDRRPLQPARPEA